MKIVEMFSHDETEELVKRLREIAKEEVGSKEKRIVIGANYTADIEGANVALVNTSHYNRMPVVFSKLEDEAEDLFKNKRYKPRDIAMFVIDKRYIYGKDEYIKYLKNIVQVETICNVGSGTIDQFLYMLKQGNFSSYSCNRKFKKM